ncbi:MAG: TMEM165/GDT1 family protein [Candidatus Odinarchaeia archaeon]
MVLEAFTSTLVLILVAELGDKSMLLSVVLSARYKRPYIVLAAVILGLLTVTLIGIATGFLILELIPEYVLTYFSAAIFLGIGVYYFLTSKSEEVEPLGSNLTFFTIFWLTFISEFGDKTQLAVISLTVSAVAPLEVFAGAALGFLIINCVAVAMGDKISEKLPLILVKKAAAVLFIFFGVLMLIGIL